MRHLGGGERGLQRVLTDLARRCLNTPIEALCIARLGQIQILEVHHQSLNLVVGSRRMGVTDPHYQSKRRRSNQCKVAGKCRFHDSPRVGFSVLAQFAGIDAESHKSV